MEVTSFRLNKLASKISGRSTIERIKAERDQYEKKSRIYADKLRKFDKFIDNVINPYLIDVNELIEAVETWASMGGAEDPDAMTEAWDRVTSAISQLKEQPND